MPGSTQYVFSDILERGFRTGNYPNRTQQSRDWFRTQARKAYGASEPGVFAERANSLHTSVVPGQLYMFVYDAKTKDTLPYWDRFPVIFPFDYTNNGFYGINLHYLPPKLRAVLMDSLYNIASDKRFDDKTKIKLSYQVIKSAANVNMFKPCIKRYLTSHVKSKFIFISPIHWDTAIFLPLEDFSGASKQKVWADSRKMSS